VCNFHCSSTRYGRLFRFCSFYHVYAEGWKPDDSDWTPPRPMWCGWVLYSSWRKSTFRRFRWCRHASTSRKRRLGVIVDSQLTLSAQVAAVCRSGYYQLRQLRPLVRSMSSDAIKTLVQAFISCRLDYYNSMFYVITDGLMIRLQSVQNVAASLASSARRYDHITPVLDVGYFPRTLPPDVSPRTFPPVFCIPGHSPYVWRCRV